jgi:nucleoside permease NupC
MAFALAIVIGLAFGALDQYLGTNHVTSRLGWWTITVSGMSAPWLIVPFLAGMTQERTRRAVLLGLVVTMSALAGYFAMSNSVFESVPVANFWPRTVTMAASGANPLWILGGLITGPIYAYFGHRWRVARSWVGAALVTLALCFEPLGRAIAGTRFAGGGLSGSHAVWGAEVAVGLAAAVVFVSMLVSDRRAARRTA